MSEIADDSQPSRVKDALEVLMRLAAGDFSARAAMSGCGDEMDALVAGNHPTGVVIIDHYRRRGRGHDTSRSSRRACSTIARRRLNG